MSSKRRRRHSPEQIGKKLRDEDAMLNAGKNGSETRSADLEAKLTRRNTIVAKLLEGCLGCCLQKRNTEKG